MKLSLMVDDVYMCPMRAHLKQLADRESEYLESLLVQKSHCSSYLPKFHMFSFMVNLSSSLPPKIEFKFSDDICRSAARYTPPQLKLSVTAGQLLVDQCLK